MDRRMRILVVALLCLSSIGVGVQYESTAFRSYPEPGDIITDPAGSDGKTVLLFADVTSASERSGKLTVSITQRKVTGVGTDGFVTVADRHEITVQSVDPTVLDAVEPGASIQVYGTLQDGSTVLIAEKTVVDYGGADDWNYVFGTSLLGALFAVAYFFRHWTLDWRTLCFHQRGES